MIGEVYIYIYIYVYTSPITVSSLIKRKESQCHFGIFKSICRITFATAAFHFVSRTKTKGLKIYKHITLSVSEEKRIIFRVPFLTVFFFFFYSFCLPFLPSSFLLFICFLTISFLFFYFLFAVVLFSL